MKKTRTTDWQDITVDLLSTRTQIVASVRAKRAEYSVPEDEMPPGCDGWLVVMTAFVAERGALWVGPEEDFYIETDSGVIGGKMLECRILWCESLIRKDREGCDVGKALNQLKTDVSGARLLEAYNGSRNVDEDARRSTRLIDYLEDFFDQSGDGGVEKAQAVEVVGGIVRLDFKSSHDETASAWIDIKSRKVVKSVRNGKHVYPQ